MWRIFAISCALALLGFSAQACGQTYEELLKENQELKARIRALEAEKAREGHRHDHRHEDHQPDPKHAHREVPDHDHRAYQPFAHHPHAGQLENGSLWDELFAPWPHTHFSRRGTPFVHLFFTEPAFLDRDVFFDYRYGSNVEGDTDETEIEMEIEWALTKRLGILMELPYLGLRPEDGEDETGFGDLVVAPRVLLIDTDLFLLAGHLGVSIPTGDEERDLGRGETVLEPSVSAWLDLGNWTTLQGQFGPEVSLETGDTALNYGLALSHSFQGPALFEEEPPHNRHRTYNSGHPGHGNHGQPHGHDLQASGGYKPSGGGHLRMAHGNEGIHYPPGLTTLILELVGESDLEEDRTFFELLPGISYVLQEHAEVRAGIRFPLYRPERLDAQYIFTFIYHY